MSDDKSKPVLLVKKADAKKGSLWNDVANKRIIKQHGGFDIPENDNHAIPKYHSPVEESAISSEETKETLTELEKEIQQLKEKDERATLAHHAAQQPHEQPDEEPSQHYVEQEDDLG
jgi:hypothetical protein